MASSDDFRRLGALLRELADSQPENRPSLEIWKRRAGEAETLLKSSVGLSDEVPHFVWHFLADADIRMKDLSYRESQVRAIEPIILSLEAGEKPVDAA